MPRGVYQRTPKDPTVRFWSRVHKLDGADACWLWTGALLNSGYANFYLKGKHLLAHRVAYELEVGPIPEGLTIDHLCRTTHCVNPAHLEPVTTRENTLRGTGPSAKNAVKTHCIHGHEFTPGNTYLDKRGSRHCRECNKARCRAYRGT